MAADKKIALEQYKIYIDGIEHNSDRRGSALNHFISLNSVYFVLIGVALQLPNNSKWLILVGVALLGLLTAVIFHFLIKSYRQLNGWKFKVLQEMEKELLFQPYTEEWKMLGEGKDRKKYWPFSHIEKYIPLAFFMLYLIVLLLLLLYRVQIDINFV